VRLISEAAGGDYVQRNKARSLSLSPRREWVASAVALCESEWDEELAEGRTSFVCAGFFGGKT
jgi:hypothetical protein